MCICHNYAFAMCDFVLSILNDIFHWFHRFNLIMSLYFENQNVCACFSFLMAEQKVYQISENSSFHLLYFGKLDPT